MGTAPKNKPIDAEYLLNQLKNLDKDILEMKYVQEKDVKDTYTATDENPISGKGVAVAVNTLQQDINKKSNIGHKHTKSEITDFPTSMTPTAHNQASNTINAMTDYSKATSVSAITPTDTLNVAIGKLEKALDSKGTSSFSGSYNDLTDKPTIPSVGNGTITVNQNGTKVGEFSTNQSTNAAINLTNTTYDVATSSKLGLVKSGTDITVDNSGNVSVNDDSHNHVISNVDGLQSALDGKAASSHTHDDRYYTESEVDSKLNSKANSSHTHTIANITNLQSTLDGKAASSHTHNYLPLSGGTITGGPLSIRFSGPGNWNEGIRIHDSNDWTTIALCSSDNTGDTGTSANTWSIHNNKGNFYITRNGSNSSSSAILSCINNSWSINNNAIIHAGNIGSQSVNYASSAGNADTVDGHHFNWSGQGGQPTWVWGGNDSSNMYVYNPSNFSVNYANGAGTVKGSYTYNGGQQNPNYFGVNKVGFLMMNTTVNGDNHYKDWIIMDCYSGSDVGGATAIGVDRQEMRAFIMGSDADRTSWTRSAELITTSNIGSQSVNYANTAGSAPASDVYSWAKASTPDGLFEGSTYTGNIDSYTESTLRPGKSYYISTTNISSSSALPFSGYGILTSYAVGSAIVQQIFRYNGSSKIIDAIYTRMYINNGWTSWSKVALTKV